MSVTVDELGYGNAPVALFNGGMINTLISSSPFCTYSYNNPIPCKAGQSIIGWRKKYSLNGNQSGTFKYQNTSSVSPWTTKSDTLYIQ